MPDWLPVAISGLALLVSAFSVTISFENLRASGHRVKIIGHRFAVKNGERWLEVKVANAGRSEVQIESSSTNWYGETVTSLPMGLRGGSSLKLLFLGDRGQKLDRGALTFYLELGSGSRVARRLPVSEKELGALVEPGPGAVLDVDLARPSQLGALDLGEI